MDPYVTVGIAGHRGRTKVIWNNQDPQWKQQINVAIRVSDKRVGIVMSLGHTAQCHKDLVLWVGTAIMSSGLSLGGTVISSGSL